jgi:hypothetical protein
VRQILIGMPTPKTKNGFSELSHFLGEMNTCVLKRTLFCGIDIFKHLLKLPYS